MGFVEGDLCRALPANGLVDFNWTGPRKAVNALSEVPSIGCPLLSDPVYYT